MNPSILESRTLTEMLEPALPHQRAILGVLAIADRYRLPPAPFLHALAVELPNRYRGPIHQLAEELESGVELTVAIMPDPKPGASASHSAAPIITDPLAVAPFDRRLMPTSMVIGLKMAARDQRLPKLFAAALERVPESRTNGSGNDENWMTKNLRFAVRTFFFVAILTFFMLRIVPEFIKMLAEFEIGPPPIMLLLIEISIWIMQFWFIVPLIALLLIPFHFSSIRAFVRRFSPLVWQHVEMPKSVQRRRTLALATESEVAVMDWESLRKQRVISAKEAKVLSMTDDPETQAWLLRWSATNRQQYLVTRATVVGRMLLTVGNVLLGLLVLLICVSVMSVMTDLIKMLSQW